MSDELVDALARQGVEEESVDNEVDTPTPEPVEEAPPLTDFGKRYLQTIEDESERQIAERHVRRWDAGYAKQEQNWNQFRQQYEQLGDYERVTQGVQLRNLLDTNPLALAQYLHEKGIIYSPPEAEQQSPGEVDPVSSKLAQVEQMTTALAQKMQAEEQARNEAQQVTAFHSALDVAEKELGAFDREHVITLIAGGVPSIEAAVKMHQRLVQNSVNQNARQQAPTLLGSSGTPPTTKKPEPGKMTNKEVNDYLVALISPEG